MEKYLDYNQKMQLLKGEVVKNLNELKKYITKIENGIVEEAQEQKRTGKQKFLNSSTYTKAMKENIQNIEQIEAFTVELYRIKHKKLD